VPLETIQDGNEMYSYLSTSAFLLGFSAGLFFFYGPFDFSDPISPHSSGGGIGLDQRENNLLPGREF